MRGQDLHQDAMFSYLSPEQRVRKDHPLRVIRRLTGEALQRLSRRFDQMYSWTGRPSIPPEKLLRALLLQILYTIRSERLLMEQLDCNLLFRWFVGLNMDDAVWDATVFSKNRDRLLEGDVAEAFFDQVLAEAQGRDLLSDEHFTVDGTLVEAWASQKARKKVEEIFGWMKTVGLLRKHRGRQCVGWIFTLTAAAYNLIQIRNLARAAPAGAR